MHQYKSWNFPKHLTSTQIEGIVPTPLQARACPVFLRSIESTYFNSSLANMHKVCMTMDSSRFQGCAKMDSNDRKIETWADRTLSSKSLLRYACKSLLSSLLQEDWMTKPGFGWKTWENLCLQDIFDHCTKG